MFYEAPDTGAVYYQVDWSGGNGLCKLGDLSFVGDVDVVELDF